MDEFNIEEIASVWASGTLPDVMIIWAVFYSLDEDDYIDPEIIYTYLN